MTRELWEKINVYIDHSQIVEGQFRVSEGECAV
jgi:hypothetical protein